jgi:hypothetical protein
LCDKGTDPISQFADLLDRGVRLDIHDEVDHPNLTKNYIFVYPMLFHCSMVGIHSGGSATMEGEISLNVSFNTVLRWT